MRWSFNSKLHF